MSSLTVKFSINSSAFLFKGLLLLLNEYLILVSLGISARIAFTSALFSAGLFFISCCVFTAVATALGEALVFITGVTPAAIEFCFCSSAIRKRALSCSVISSSRKVFSLPPLLLILFSSTILSSWNNSVVSSSTISSPIL